MGEAPGCLVRYGLTGHVGRFAVDPAGGLELGRGQAVVVRTDRGIELGEVLVPATAAASGDLDESSPRLLRAADPEDLDAARRCESLRPARFEACLDVLDGAGWDLVLLDVEPLLDLETTILHVLADPDADLALLRARFRSVADLDVVFEACGADPLAAPARTPAARGGCGDCDCSSGGCGSRAAEPEPEPAAASCGTAGAHSGCASCGLKRR
ncbi:hypothetical protein [Aquisphaera insulae]|uniref:hypothetical protein n=1 Tax=Aquisphaera insulae TaxID=2712864 RepID=UPI0013ECCE2C|nr:hypothetical protein [Aquisphaera insulae]